MPELATPQQPISSQENNSTLFIPPSLLIKKAKKFKVKFQDSKNIIYTMIIHANTPEEAMYICQTKFSQFNITKFLEVVETK